MSGITEHRNAHLNDLNMHEVKGFPAALVGSSTRKNIQGDSEFKRDFRQDNVINIVNGFVTPLTEVDGDVYVLTTPSLDVDSFVFQSGTTIKVGFAAGYSNIYAVGNFFQSTGAVNAKHNGVFVITTVAASTINITITAITDSSDDVVSGSTALAYITHEDYDPENLSNGQSIPREGIVRFNNSLDLWFGDDFIEGDNFLDLSTNVIMSFDGTETSNIVKKSTVVQETSRTNSVTNNFESGIITTVGAVLNSGVAFAFTLNNSLVQTDSVVLISLTHPEATVPIVANVDTQVVGSFDVVIRNASASTNSASVVFNVNFRVI